jgi:hypothetical protein
LAIGTRSARLTKTARSEGEAKCESKNVAQNYLEEYKKRTSERLEVVGEKKAKSRQKLQVFVIDNKTNTGNKNKKIR